MSLFLALSLSVVITLFLYLAYDYFFSSSRRVSASLERRVNQLLKGQSDTARAADAPRNKGAEGAPMDKFQSYVDQITTSRRINNWLLLAGISYPLYKIILGLMIVSAALFVAFVAFNLPLYLCAAAILLVWSGPYVYFNSVRAKYIHQFSEQLPNALGMMANTVMVGHTAESAIKLLTEVAPKPLSGEFDKIHKEMLFGASFGEALRNLFHRVPTTEVRIMVTALAIQQRSGGNLAEILRNLENMIRDYSAVKREAKSVTAESKASMLVMCILPFAVVGPQILKNPAPFLEFLATPTGKMIYGAAALLMVGGIFLFAKLTKLEDF